MASPVGYRYPRALPWDMSAEDLELALEATNDVGEVTVSYAEETDGTRSYKITFDVRNASYMYMNTGAHSNKLSSVARHCCDMTRKHRGVQVSVEDFYCSFSLSRWLFLLSVLCIHGHPRRRPPLPHVEV